MQSEPLRRTPLFETHVRAGARLVPFAGWEMPVQYAGVLPEVKAVREAVGLFDVSHMGRARIQGPGALAYLQRLTVNDVSTLSEGTGQYSLLCNDAGGVIDDVIVYRLEGEESFGIVFNAGCRAKDWAWMQKQAAGFDLRLTDVSDATALLAVQGPQAIAALGAEVAALPRFGIGEARVCGREVLAARTGYTGEDGAELFIEAGAAAALWDALAAAGAVPCGLGARDTLRLEAALPLYGHEMDETVNPYQARLGWVVKRDKPGDFLGKAALAARADAPRDTVTVGIEMEGRGIPREGYPVHRPDGPPVGRVTSGTFSPMRGKGIALVRLDAGHGKRGTLLEVRIRDSGHLARVVALPFYKNV